jgi:hypothetical protein
MIPRASRSHRGVSILALSYTQRGRHLSTLSNLRLATRQTKALVLGSHLVLSSKSVLRPHLEFTMNINPGYNHNFTGQFFLEHLSCHDVVTRTANRTCATTFLVINLDKSNLHHRRAPTRRSTLVQNPRLHVRSPRLPFQLGLSLATRLRRLNLLHRGTLL